MFVLFPADVSGMTNKFNNDNIKDKVKYYFYTSFLFPGTQSQALGCVHEARQPLCERQWFKIPSLLENLFPIRNVSPLLFFCYTLLCTNFTFLFLVQKTKFCTVHPITANKYHGWSCFSLLNLSHNRQK